jgi:hypothetical protein
MKAKADPFSRSAWNMGERACTVRLDRSNQNQKEPALVPRSTP